jgi:hypothetical protein
MRVTGVAMPRPTVPDIEPDASKTIIASSLHGSGWSAAGALDAKDSAQTRAIAKKRGVRTRAALFIRRV